MKKTLIAQPNTTTSFSSNSFGYRHLGLSQEELQEMLKFLKVKSLEELIQQTIPASIRTDYPLDIGEGLTETEYLQSLKNIADKNQVFRSYIGLGYYNCIVPTVIQRNVFENPAWYTAYTPYQAEISQGRLEALLNFQTMVSDLTGMEIANASLLDEATAAAEAMLMLYRIQNKSSKKETRNVFFVSEDCFPQTIEVIQTRANPLNIELVIGNHEEFEFNDKVFGVLLQYPSQTGNVTNYQSFVEKAHEKNALVVAASDLLALTLLTPPGEWGADVVVGNTQRFGVPLGYGGPHAAFFATKEKYARQLPGRIIGVSQDRQGKKAYRMALQTREQHIRRDKATSNICTAQALLAMMASFYAVYHGAEGLKRIAQQVHALTQLLVQQLDALEIPVVHEHYFDTISVYLPRKVYHEVRNQALERGINLRYFKPNFINISLDECTTPQDVLTLTRLFAMALDKKPPEFPKEKWQPNSMQFPKELTRKSAFLEHPVFKVHRTETEMLRYIKSLENKDLSLTHSMIPLGSCTMKLNATTSLMPVSWEAFSNIHPFAPIDQTEGYLQVFNELEKQLCKVTGFEACSLQPNSGAQGEFAGLMVIRAYHLDRDEGHRNIALIPTSAHGTNPASAVMSGMKVVLVKCAENGDIDLDDLRTKAEKYQDNLAALMITYPSTHGVFEEGVKEATDIIHQYGGLVYMDGANMNAQVGLTNPANIGADVCHLNLHKTFSIPHGGGGPGMGPICCNEKLAPYLPSHGFFGSQEDTKNISAVSATPWSSASILLIAYGYIKMLGDAGLTASTQYAILNANYIKERLDDHFPILYVGENGRVAHELILDFREYQKSINVTVEDISKRLMDYGFHAPTVSFPVNGTLMIEPTESESKAELDRFCEAMIAIKGELDAITDGSVDPENNVLKNAPHTLEEVTANDWDYPYSRQEAAYPLDWVRQHKFWASVARISNSYGDRNLMCSCPPLESYV